MLSPTVLSALEELAGGLSVSRTESASGGCISDAAIVVFEGGQRWFVKANRVGLMDMFTREAEGLAALAEVGAVRVPAGARVGRAGGEAFIAMEAIASGSPGGSFFSTFGRRFAELHEKSVGTKYGFQNDNYIGSTRQPNSWSEDWTEFWSEHRLGFQLQLTRSTGRSDRRLDRLGDRLLDRLQEFIGGTGEPPCLLHGDLWSGNFMVDEDGDAVLIDPASYYGQREADLAMTRLFGGFGGEFYSAYEEAWPLPPDSSVRLEVYKLYHLLNHLNLFGSGYRAQCVDVLERLVG